MLKHHLNSHQITEMEVEVVELLPRKQNQKIREETTRMKMISFRVLSVLPLSLKSQM
jgi:hypothetical protein